MHTFAQLKIPAGHIGIHWFGQSSFAIKDDAGTIVQVDPYFPHERPAERFIHAVPPLDEAELPTNFVLLTHNHRDHTWPGSLLRIHRAFPAARFIGPAESAKNMVESGIPPELATAITVGDDLTMDTMRAHAVWAKPLGGAPEDGIKAPDVAHLGYVIEASGTRIYISGDPINTFGDHNELLEPIAALKPDLGLLTTHPNEGEFPYFDGSAKTAHKLGLRSAVPAHYQCFVKRTYDPNEWASVVRSVGVEPLIIPYNGHILYPVVDAAG